MQMKKNENLFPKPPPAYGKGDKARPRDDKKWEESPFWKSTSHYDKNKWAYNQGEK